MTTDAQTQAIPRARTTVIAPRDSEVAASDPEVATPAPEVEDAHTEWVQEMHEAAVAKLVALHDGWTAAMAEILERPSSWKSDEAAA